jgi:LuxR family transcriptional regulator, quorum-sensing system regulator SolR
VGVRRIPLKAWQDEQLQVLLAEEDEYCVFEKVAEIARKLGFDHCAYGIRASIPVSRQRIMMFNTYPTEWRDRYTKQNYLAVDPTVQHGLRSMLPIVWTDELFVKARDFWEDAREHDLRFGWAQPCRDSQGVLGMLTVARSNEELSRAEMQDKSIRLSWLSQITHMAMARIVVKKLVPEATVRLSIKETAVIRWTAEGKSAAEISEIMGLSIRTVTFHVSNVVKKLNAANKTAAAVRAAVLGLIY